MKFIRRPRPINGPICNFQIQSGAVTVFCLPEIKRNRPIFKYVCLYLSNIKGDLSSLQINIFCYLYLYMPKHN